MLLACYAVLLVVLLNVNMVKCLELDSSGRYIILSLHDLGFANRIRSIADFSKIALISNRTLLLSWLPSPACNITFDELYESGPSHIELVDLSFLNPRDEDTFYSAVEEAVLGSNMTFYSMHKLDKELITVNNMESFFIKRDKFLSDIQVIMASYNGVLALENMSCQQVSQPFVVFMCYRAHCKLSAVFHHAVSILSVIETHSCNQRDCNESSRGLLQ
jgi:hypothetical protein